MSAPGGSSTVLTGRQGEDFAAAYLADLGYTVVERNFRIRGGEIDLVALDGDTVVFVEVKNLPHGDADTLGTLLGPRKRQNIIKTAKCYLQKHRQYNDRYIRFDVLALDVPGLGPVHHIVNAFSE